MRQPTSALATAIVGLLSCPLVQASDLTLEGQTDPTLAPGSTGSLVLSGGSGLIASVAFDVDPGPVILFGEFVPIGLTPSFVTILSGITDPAGQISLELPIPTAPEVVGSTFYFAGAILDPTDPNGVDVSNGVSLTIDDVDVTPIEVELFGVERPGAPFFDWVVTAQEFEPLDIAIDPADQPQAVGSATVYLVADRSQAEWEADTTLVDLSGNGPDSITITATDVQSNVFEIDTGTISGGTAALLGIGFDVVVDLDGDGRLSSGDLIDGFADGAGMYVTRDPSLPGPYTPVELTYSGGPQLDQNLFYPSNIDELDQVHLIVVSHGNGHNYQWYDHIGNHLASYGYVVMSHFNNTVPGIETASTTTLINTEGFLANLDFIAGGVLDGKIIRDEIAWVGHSRGGEGIVRAYDRLVDNNFVSAEYDEDDIVLLSSIAPTVFNGPNQSDPHDVDFHLWTGAGDTDVNGCSASNVTQCFQLYGRAQGQRQSTALYGVGHAWFHNGTGTFNTGPCQLDRPRTHEIMRGYILPLMEWHLRENPAARDFLVRQYEDLRPDGVETPSENPCVIVNLQYEERAADGKLVIEDFQTQPDPLVASSGVAITNDFDAWVTARADDSDGTFTAGNDPMNGVTYAQTAGPEQMGALLHAGNQDRTLTFQLDGGTNDWSGFGWLAFRAAQSTRSPETVAVNGDQHFVVRLIDGNGNLADMSTASIGAGLEEPYQRTGCGSGVGWNNELETVRMGLRGFRAINPDLDLANLDRLEFKFGPSFGTPNGRLVIDDIELLID